MSATLDCALDSNLASRIQSNPADDPLVMYIVLRKDLAKTWPSGSMVTQACHAVTKVLAKHPTDSRVVEYLDKLETMHKVVLGIKNLGQLRKLQELMCEAAMDHEEWVELPEDTVTAIATLPYRRSVALPFFKTTRCELYKN
ncbi:hypothetical protein BATDEDRAFT_25933 [Batrachochytrium dendrobatidis JAM81]|uniref:peptidyl-tRNA hydrolase n=2 Tax=Batrachochytrium dendrobatidis TaxID=109871 RepID=F4P627_BATDJ|nr:uncharacterized protein BATDEDRAFT_25933 [Batrachochytrium dendrobatidis JAM81]EGF79529.1 hypothetical protein BATDEDRAFT_25933 [Batrachochytrium dendrobatidis JAM81]KAJ8322919.1 peptidyl-tRNA hydrolase domain-containing protein 1 [Batrachochytrium dendrobatidis]KAK5665762.1 peptidyl-tRNA hydrolase domain-containing protein 1 [Batrachochytrium dendrobatidis]OAJ42701.1 hypothetical protein BDEG_26120 [Batrachochytrium dendrobatidis JEL423]|eukprot:XP_006679914.1 hypothetical protein BATDEDRAFT_25933 [Batrachochytrium dendrobatidis JAM81]